MSVDTEQWRHECEVRWLANLPTNKERTEHLKGVEKKRGRPAMLKLLRDAKVIFDERAENDNE
jgi:hypothetical protein